MLERPDMAAASIYRSITVDLALVSRASQRLAGTAREAGHSDAEIAAQAAMAAQASSNAWISAAQAWVPDIQVMGGGVAHHGPYRAVSDRLVPTSTSSTATELRGSSQSVSSRPWCAPVSPPPARPSGRARAPSSTSGSWNASPSADRPRRTSGPHHWCGPLVVGGPPRGWPRLVSGSRTCGSARGRPWSCRRTG